MTGFRLSRKVLIKCAHFSVCTVCMGRNPSENAWVSEVKCNRIIENKRNKTEKKEKKEKVNFEKKKS